MFLLAMVMHVGADFEGLGAVGALVEVVAGVRSHVLAQDNGHLEGLAADVAFVLAYRLMHVLLMAAESVGGVGDLAADVADVFLAAIVVSHLLVPFEAGMRLEGHIA